MCWAVPTKRPQGRAARTSGQWLAVAQQKHAAMVTFMGRLTKRSRLVVSVSVISTTTISSSDVCDVRTRDHNHRAAYILRMSARLAMASWSSSWIGTR